MKKVALLVGVEHYRDKLTARVNYAYADVMALAEALHHTCGFQIRSLVGSQGASAAVLGNVNNAIAELTVELQPEDLFLFCFIGHCVEKGDRAYLLLRDSRQASPDEGSLSLQALRKALERFEAKRRILLIDAFRNSPHKWRPDADNCMSEAAADELLGAAAARLEGGATTALLSACQVGQRSYDWPGEKHGVFAHFLLKGLNGAAWTEKRLDLVHLATCADRDIRGWSANVPRTSAPQMVWYQEFGEPVPILLAGEPGTPLETAPRPTPAQVVPFADWEQEPCGAPASDAPPGTGRTDGKDSDIAAAAEAKVESVPRPLEAPPVKSPRGEPEDAPSVALDSASPAAHEVRSENRILDIRPEPLPARATDTVAAGASRGRLSAAVEALEARYPEIPLVPQSALDLERSLKALEQTLRDLEADCHPDLQPMQDVVHAAQEHHEARKDELETHPSDIDEPTRTRLAEATRRNPGGSVTDLCALAPGVPTRQLLPYVRQLRDSEHARRAVESAREQYEGEKRRAIHACRTDMAVIETRLQEIHQNDLEAVLAVFFDRMGDPLEFPLDRWIEFEPVLLKRHYRWDPREILARGEMYHRQRLYARSLRFERGDNEQVDPDKALQYLRKAAELGHSDAQFDLAEKHYAGKQLPQDHAEAARWYRKAAAQNHAAAQFNLGWCYFRGAGVPQDHDKAVRLYRAAAEQGYAPAQFQLGWCYYTGTVVPRDRAEAVRWHRQAAEQGHPEAQFALGWCYSTGDGVQQDRGEAVKWYGKAAEQGHPEAQYTLGWCYSMGAGVEQSDGLAVHWYRKAAEQGHADAQFNLASRYFRGNGVARDRTEAAKWFRRAAEQDYVRAQSCLAQCYAAGAGVPRNVTEAAKWFRKAAERGHRLAQHSLARCCSVGDGMAQDSAEAARWFRKAAEQDYAPAQFALARCYANGNGVRRDRVESVKWYRKAADQGHPEAQYSLGARYCSGDGVERDMAEAVRWFRKAAEQGHMQAQYNLASCYHNGLGVTRNPKQAKLWFRKAAGQGHETAKRMLEEPGS